VDDQVLKEYFLVVSSDFLDVEVVLGSEFCSYDEFIIDRDETKIQDHEKLGSDTEK